MTLLLNLYLGHLLGDFVLQPAWLVMAKRRGITGLLIHTAIIGLCTAAILFEELSSLWNIVLLAMAAHLAIEVFSIRFRAFEHVSGLSVFLVDQALHMASLVILVWLATPVAPVGEITTFGFSVDPAVVAMACGLVVVTFMGSIIIFELANAVGPDSWNRDILPWSVERVVGMVERGTALLAGVLTNPIVMIAVFIPRIIWALRRPSEERARQMLIATAGLAICILTWAFVIFTSSIARAGS
jgi:hypothetical protein